MAAVKIKFKAVQNNPEYLPLKTVLSQVDVTDYKTRDDTIRFFEQYSLPNCSKLPKAASLIIRKPGCRCNNFGYPPGLIYPQL